MIWEEEGMRFSLLCLQGGSLCLVVLGVVVVWEVVYVLLGFFDWLIDLFCFLSVTHS